MIEPDDTIRFQPKDVPDVPEVRKPRKRQRKKRDIPEPKDWRPFGGEWWIRPSNYNIYLGSTTSLPFKQNEQEPRRQSDCCQQDDSGGAFLQKNF